MTILEGGACAPDLDIVIVTYNRSEHLQHTLEALAASPFRCCSITVLDNCSTDGTPDVTARARAAFPNYRVVRHPVNIGGNANILRAFECATARYIWVMGDDDRFDWDAAAEVMAICRSGDVDVISIWMADHPGLRRGTAIPIRAYASAYRRFFFNHSFITGTIFRADLVSDTTLQLAYDKIASSYPQLAFAECARDREGTMYVPTKPLVSRGGEDVTRWGSGHRNNIVWFMWWCSACQIIKDADTRSLAMDDGFNRSVDFYAFMLNEVWENRSKGNMLHARALLTLAAYQKKRRLAYCLLLLPVYAVPRSVAKALDGVRNRIAGMFAQAQPGS